MNVTILAHTPDPMGVISRAAGTCYGKPTSDLERVRRCVRRDHTSVLEHAGVTFTVGGVSRACQNQLVRHRMASFCVESQRYCRVDVGGDWYVIPPSIAADESATRLFRDHMTSTANTYLQLLDKGIPAEDARYVLPNACATNLVMTMNWRELYHFWDLRLDKRAQWEVRALAGNMLDACDRVPDLEGMVDIYRKSRDM